ncbi:MAG: hypothetical protein IPM79_36165 [Polyangiaceae bacterium]|nr:hypothetical protein [Polyangiaceae bacterium]MBK8942892.1 hypothetical protein [Polyangiaceae bacterium]
MAATNGKKKPRTLKVQRDEFLRDPAAVMRRALTSGRVEIVDAAGERRAVITVPQDTLRVPKL